MSKIKTVCFLVLSCAVFNCSNNLEKTYSDADYGKVFLKFLDNKMYLQAYLMLSREMMQFEDYYEFSGRVKAFHDQTIKSKRSRVGYEENGGSRGWIGVFYTKLDDGETYAEEDIGVSNKNGIPQVDLFTIEYKNSKSLSEQEMQQKTSMLDALKEDNIISKKYIIEANATQFNSCPTVCKLPIIKSHTAESQKIYHALKTKNLQFLGGNYNQDFQKTLSKSRLQSVKFMGRVESTDLNSNYDNIFLYSMELIYKDTSFEIFVILSYKDDTLKRMQITNFIPAHSENFFVITSKR